MENELSGIDPKLLTKQAAAIKAVQNLEFKRGCRKIALEVAAKNKQDVDACYILEDADLIYKWLLKH